MDSFASGATPQLSSRRIASVWWPLAASWMLMGIELPILTAVVERMENPHVNLAAYGSVVLPLSLLIEAPIIMLLAAATALVRDQPSYRRLFRFMMITSAALTAIHVAVAFSPVFDWIFRELLDAPEELRESARRGLQIMTPWTWAIAYRRMQHGVLIRAGHSRAVGAGTLMRLGANLLAMFLVAKLTDWPGIVVGSVGVATGVTAEAIFSGVLVRPILRDLSPAEVEGAAPLTWSRLGRFYAPLALTPFLTLILPLVGAAAMSRMSNPMLSLAAWPAVHGLVFLLRGVGMAYNEVVVALANEPGATRALFRFSRYIAAATMAILVLLVATPMAGLWFEHVMNLSPELARTTRLAVSLCLLMPGYQVLQSYYQGTLVASGKTRAVPEAVALYSLLAGFLLWIGVERSSMIGIYYTVLAFSCGGVTQTLWLWFRSRDLIREHLRKDSALVASHRQVIDP